MSLQVGIVKYESVLMEEQIAIYSEAKAGTLEVGAMRCGTDVSELPQSHLPYCTGWPTSSGIGCGCGSRTKA
jgi:hypothetical protein